MSKFVQFLNQPSIGLDITLLSSMLALLGGLYLAYEFTDRKWGFLRLPFQISLPMLAAILISIPPAILVYFIELLPPVQDLFYGSPLPPFSFIICGAFIGLFHGVFSNPPTGQITTTAAPTDSKRKRRAWSGKGILQGLSFGALLGFFYSFVIAIILTNKGQNFINFFYSYNFLPDLASSSAIGGIAALAGLVWRGRLHKPLYSKAKKTPQSPKPHLSWRLVWRLIKYPFDKLHGFFFNTVVETQAKKETGPSGTSESTVSQLLLAIQHDSSYPGKESQKPYKRFDKDEGILALRFWLVIVLLFTLFLFIGITITIIGDIQNSRPLIYQYVFICLYIILLIVFPGWIAGGLASHSHRIAHRELEHGAKKMLGYTGIILTLFAFGLQLIQPLVQELKPLSGFDESINSIAWSPDGTMIAIAMRSSESQTDGIQIIQADTGNLYRTYDLSSKLDADAKGIGMLWSDDGEFIASNDDTGNVQVLNLQNGSSIFTPGVSTSHSYTSLAWWSSTSSTGDDYLAVAWNNTDTVQVEDATTETVSSKLSCPTATGHLLDRVDWSPDEKYLASLYCYNYQDNNPDYETPLCIWNMQTGKRIANERIPGFYITFDRTGHYTESLNWSSSERQSENPSMNEFFQQLEAKQYCTVYFYELPSNSQNSLTVWSDNEKYLAISENNTVNIWNTQQNKEVLTYNGHYVSITDIAWSPDGTHIATEDMNGVVEVWDATTGSHLLTYSPTD